MRYSALLMLFMSATIAQANTHYSGFYLTGALGGTSARFKIDQSLVFNVPSHLTSSLPQHIKQEGTAFAGLLGVGYSYEFKSSFVLAAEATAGLTDAKISDKNIQHVTLVNYDLGSSLQSELKNDFAIVLKPGYGFEHNTQIYGLIGPRWGYFDSSLESGYFSRFKGEPTAADATASESGYQLGLTVGLGMQRMLTKHFSVSLEYAYTTYGEIETLTNIIDATAAFESPGALTDEVQLSTSSNNLLAKFNYFF